MLRRKVCIALCGASLSICPVLLRAAFHLMMCPCLSLM
jgi:hypothetical protein